MIPRSDPETRQSVGTQVLKRRRYDQYGAERGRLDLARPAHFETRNGLPFAPYIWRRNDPERDAKMAQERAERDDWVQKTRPPRLVCTRELSS